MTLLEAIEARHSVRKYKDIPLPEDVIAVIKQKIDQVNSEGNLHIQLITNEPKGFKSILNYGLFGGISNYFVVAGKIADDLDERAGYYGEQLVLLAQQLGLNTCWAGLTYKKVEGTYTLGDGEKIVCYIALGYGETQGTERKHRSISEISNVSDDTPDWFRKGVEAARLAPTAVNQQKFFLEYVGEQNGKPLVKAKKKFSLAGYTSLDLGIVKLHFEIGAGKDKFEWC
ncbi:MAG: nitroreductase [Paludibacteraceae bacterium]|nr:nitroreductase [Paludibacteraceae bacterium]